MASANVESKEDEETDSSGSDYDNVDIGIVKTAKRKILKVMKKILPTGESSEKYKQQAVKFYNSTSSNTYDFNHEKRGCCIIINNDKFTNMLPRPGSVCDVKSMETEFANLGFDVKIYNNLTANYLHKKLRKVCMKYDHEKADCFVCIILSHGDQQFDIKRERSDIIFGSDGRCITVAEVMEIFSDPYCPGLLGKPRLFFIQACRGDKIEKGVKMTIEVIKKKEVPVNRKFTYPGTQSGEGNEASVDGKDDKVLHDMRTMTIDSDDEEDFERYKKGLDSLVTTPSPCYTDSLVMFASPPGYFAFRRDSGSWFMKSLTHVLQTSPRSKSFQQMLTHVSYEMSMNYQSKNRNKPTIDGCVTIPCVMSMLTKDIYFHPK